LQRACSAESVDIDRARTIFEDIRSWNVALDSIDLEFLLRRKIEQLMVDFRENPDDVNRLAELRGLMEFVAENAIDLNYWKAQNIYFEMAAMGYPRFSAGAGVETGEMWPEEFRRLGELMSFDTTTILRGK
jgi:hypothetical protein